MSKRDFIIQKIKKKFINGTTKKIENLMLN